MTFKTFGFASLLALGTIATGCASDPTGPAGGGDDQGSDTGSNTGGGDDVPHSLDVAGKYKMTSTFDIASNVPGTAGTIVNDIIDATDEPDDPSKWVIEQLVNQLPNSGIGGQIKSLMQSFGTSAIAAYVNPLLLNWAPDFVTTMVALGNDFGDITKHFGLNETFEIGAGGPDGTYGATRTEIGAHFVINNQTFDLAFADHNIQNVVVPNINTSFEQSGKLTVATHKVPLPYGGILHMGLDAAIIPMLDANASNLNQLLADKVDCATLGQELSDWAYQQFGFTPGASVFSTACTAGLNAAANAIYTKIDSLSGTALEFDIDGTATARDTNGDYKTDVLQTGKWEGNLNYASTPAALPPGATFTGTRM
ncbi:MAG: hypothetical protein QM831_27295 [Kofleriaceae bacterium]